nr:CTOST-IIIHIG [synthetic construct]
MRGDDQNDNRGPPGPPGG